jgi:uncharacterized protein (TIGR03437 family)
MLLAHLSRGADTAGMFRNFWAACGFSAVAAVGFAQPPSIAAIQNNYSYIVPGAPNYGIAQGSLFVIEGSNLSTVSSGLQAFPLPTSLAGVTVNLSAGGKTTQAILYYALPTQIGAVLPSSTPTGNATVTVTVNGATSNSVQIQVVQSAFGILTLNGGGSGRAAAFDLNNNLLSNTNAANPGAFLTLWGSGVGASSPETFRCTRRSVTHSAPPSYAAPMFRSTPAQNGR